MSALRDVDYPDGSWRNKGDAPMKSERIVNVKQVFHW